ncbi:MAG: NAD(P)H-hydrate epimerase, partial [Thermoguttaceae bacterium]
MYFLTRDQSRLIDSVAIEKYGMSGVVLMENAACGVVEVLQKLNNSEQVGTVTICCGKGNNGGDGFAIARRLIILGQKVNVWLFADPDSLTGDAATNFKILEKMNPNYLHGAVEKSARSESDFPNRFRCSCYSAESHNDYLSDLAGSNWIIDALLGTGTTGAPRHPFDVAISAINEARAEKSAKVLAVDLPSGLDADTGIPGNPTIRADHTCTFVTKKIGFQTVNALPFLGTVHVVNLWIPPQIL